VQFLCRTRREADRQRIRTVALVTQRMTVIRAVSLELLARLTGRAPKNPDALHGMMMGAMKGAGAIARRCV